MALNIILAVALLALVGAVIFLFARQKTAPDQSLVLLQGQISAFQKQFTDQLGQITTQINSQLQGSSQILQQTNQAIGQRLDNAAKVVGEVQNRLGQLDEAGKRIFEVGKDIAGLQDILRASKIRGNIGEFFLGDLLGQIFPPNYFTLQYAFKSGEKVDAVVRAAKGLVPIDAKFPLEGFRKMIEAQAEAEKKTARKQFIGDVKKHIDSIAQKYILPGEGTLDFALMYIPAENVYYETIIREEKFGETGGLDEYARQRRVFPVSPNSLYPLLATILLGLQGLQIEKNAQRVIEQLKGLAVEMGKFKKDFELIGTHVGRAHASFDQAQKRLDHFEGKLNLSAAHVAPEIAEAKAVESLPEVV